MSNPTPGPDGLEGRDPFTAHRALLFTIAYEMLGSAADAEDVVQDSWLRWSAVDQSEVADPRAYLARVVTRQSLNRLRTLQRQRESYVGPWLPEPLVTAADVAEDTELAEAVSFAMLVVLESLGPVERAVFVLREVFGFGYDDIAVTVDRSVPAVRQIAHRAREHVQARRPARRPDRAEHQQVVQRFVAAAAGGDLQALLEVLAPEAVLVSDTGGKAQAARRTITGADKIARLLVALRTAADEVRMDPVTVNGASGAGVSTNGGPVDSLFSVDVQDGRVTAIYLVRNPDKLVSLERREVAR
jgi:RNA polymerase sigma-70 factor (ECF subfamily)